MTELTLIEKALLLKKTDIFGSLDLDLLLPICDTMDEVSYRKGEVIFEKDALGSHLYLVVEGVVFLENPDTGLTAHTSRQNLFGDEALLSGQTRGYSATSHTDTRLLMLSRSHLLTILSECPMIAVTLLRHYATACPFRTL